MVAGIRRKPKSEFTVAPISKSVVNNKVSHDQLTNNMASPMPLEMAMRVLHINELNTNAKGRQPAPVKHSATVTSQMPVVHFNDLGENRSQKIMEELEMKYKQQLALNRQSQNQNYQVVTTQRIKTNK